MADRHLTRVLGALRRGSPSSRDTAIVSVERGFSEWVTAGRDSTVRRTHLWESVELLLPTAEPPTAQSHGRAGLSHRRAAPRLPASSASPRRLGPRARTVVGVGGALLGLLASRRAVQSLPAGQARPRSVGPPPSRALPRA